MKNGYGVVRVWWLVNSLIHNHHRLTFYEKNQCSGEYAYWCEWNDSQYNENREDICGRKIYFVNVSEKEIEVYLREKE